MEFDLSEEQEMVRRLVRDFAEREIAPVIRDHDRAGCFPWEIIRKMSPLGLLGAPVPQEYGGMGVDFITYAIIIEQLGHADTSLRTTVSVHSSLAELAILYYGNEEQRRRYLPRLASGEIIGGFSITEPNVGSDAAGMQTIAAQDGDTWVLNGNKLWVTNGALGGLAIVFAQTDRSQGVKGISAFIVEAVLPGFTATEIRGKMGLRSSSTAEFVFEDCRVPQENLLGQIGDGFKIAMACLDNGRLGIAAGCVGLAQACIDASVKYARERKQFGRPIGSFQLVQDKVAEMVIETEAARFLVYRAAYLKNKGERNTREASIAKLYASEAAKRAADRAIQIHGSYGYSDEYPVERHYRDVRADTIYEGTSEIQKLIVGRHTLGIDAFA
ncbi:MAG: acyl-CoA dehydrogenase family protein [Chloroflexi bacterium]|nr:acyl-CoA dehydrogenase family protein [Chloroflexota bacterium]